MEPLDPLDQLLRGPASLPLTERVRAAVRNMDGGGGRGRLIAGGLLVLLVAAGVVAAVVFGGGAPAKLSLPQTAGPPAGGATAAPSSSAAGSSGDGPSGSPTTVAVFAEVVVHVAGAVNVPGLVTLPAGARVADAIDRAGGLRPDADADRINLAAPLADGVRVFIAALGQPDPAPPAAGGSGTPGGVAPASSAPAGPVDVNRASAAELEVLPGVGPTTAAAIVAYREEHGAFRSVDELQEVRGIGPAKFEALRGLATVGP